MFSVKKSFSRSGNGILKCKNHIPRCCKASVVYAMECGVEHACKCQYEMGKRTMVFGKFLRRCGMPEKTHGLSQKIQGTYFEISALYFKIHGLYFSAFQMPDRQQLIKSLKNGVKSLIDNVLRKNVSSPIGARGMQGGMCQICHDEILAKSHCFASFCCRFRTQVMYFCLSRYLFAYKNVSFRQLAGYLKIIRRTLKNKKQ